MVSTYETRTLFQPNSVKWAAQSQEHRRPQSSQDQPQLAKLSKSKSSSVAHRASVLTESRYEGHFHPKVTLISFTFTNSLTLRQAAHTRESEAAAKQATKQPKPTMVKVFRGHFGHLDNLVALFMFVNDVVCMHSSGRKTTEGTDPLSRKCLD